MVAAARDRFTNYQSPITAMARKPGNAFEIALEKWRRGEDIS
jgi:hypothetical protein